MTLYNDELIHYGVKGMKWGRRKSDSDRSGNSGGGIRKKIANRDAEIKRQRSEKYTKNAQVYSDLYVKKITRQEAAKKFSYISAQYPRAHENTSKEILAQVGISAVAATITVSSLRDTNSSTSVPPRPPRPPRNAGAIGDFRRAKPNRKGVYNITDAAKPRRK